MINRFLGEKGRPVLVEALLSQKLVLGNETVAQAIAEKGEVIEVPEGAVLIEQGTYGQDTFFIIAGSFGVVVHGTQVQTRTVNDHVGEMTTINPSLPRSASIVSLEYSVVVKIPGDVLSDIASTYPRFWKEIAKTLAQRLYQRNEIVPLARTSIRIFIISSSEALPIARAVENQFAHDKFFTKVWTEGVFRASRYPIESLETQLDECDFAIAIAQPDDLIEVRGVPGVTPRDNVIFELGLFVGRLGRQRSFLLEPMGADVKLPSDLSGLSTIPYKTGPVKDAMSLLGPACNQLREIFNEMGPYNGKK